MVSHRWSVRVGRRWSVKVGRRWSVSELPITDYQIVSPYSSSRQPEISDFVSTCVSHYSEIFATQ